MDRKFGVGDNLLKQKSNIKNTYIAGKKFLNRKNRTKNLVLRKIF